MIISLLGPPGVGKGTVAQLFAAENKSKWLHISMGQLLREHLQEKGKYWKEVQKNLDKGTLVSDTIMAGVLLEFVKKKKSKHIILDGTPRTLNQARTLPKALKKIGLDLSGFLFFDADEKMITDRLHFRRQCAKCGRVYGVNVKPKKQGICDVEGAKLIQRKDDKLSVIRNRFRVYKEETFPVLEWAAIHYPVIYINANHSPPQILKQMQRAIHVLQ